MPSSLTPRLPDDSKKNRQLIVRYPNAAVRSHTRDVIASTTDERRDQMEGVAPFVFEGEVERRANPRENSEPIDAEFTVNTTAPTVSPTRSMATNAPNNAPAPKAAVTTIWSAAAPARTVADIQKRSFGSAWQALKSRFLQMRGVSSAAPTASQQEAPAVAPPASLVAPAAEKPAKAEKPEKETKIAA